MKRIEKDGKFYRMRRGKLVEIPSEWIGKEPHPQTRKGRTKEGRSFGTGASTIPTRMPAPASGQDERPYNPAQKPMRRRKMLPEPVVARRARVQEAIEDSS